MNIRDSRFVIQLSEIFYINKVLPNAYIPCKHEINFLVFALMGKLLGTLYQKVLNKQRTNTMKTLAEKKRCLKNV